MIALPMLNDAGTRHPLGDHPAVRAIGGLADPHERFAPKTVRELTIALATIHNSNSRPAGVSADDRIRPRASVAPGDRGRFVCDYALDAEIADPPTY